MQAYTYASSQPISTVQVTLTPNQMAISQINKLFSESDTRHFEQQLNENPLFEIGNQS